MFVAGVSFTLLWLTFFLKSNEIIGSPRVDANSKSSLGFCENGFYIPKSKKNCANGFTLGKRAPKCVCIKGIYRMYMSNCDVADGFAEEVCMLTQEEDVQVKGIKLTREPDWEKTALVCEKAGSGSVREWDYIPEFGKSKMSEGSFYTINGEAMISISSSGGKTKQLICVQKKDLADSVCLYRHNDNVDKWPLLKVLDVIVKPVCPKGNWVPLKAKKCFKPLNLLDSECQVPCSKLNIKVEDSTNVDPEDNADLDSNVTDPIPYIVHDNNFLDRKLNMYIIMQEIGSYDVTPVSTINHGPNKTFELYAVMKDIVKNYCPSKYLPKTWVEQTVELFHVLHHGDVFKYENELSQDEFQWIRDILRKCLDQRSKITLYHEDSTGADGKPSSRCDGVPKASGFCDDRENPCVETPINKIPPPYTDYTLKHYVPEVSWLVLDIVHIVCFPQFNESYRMFHILEQTVEKLFTLQIKNYWYFPSWNDRTKRRMLGTAADDFMHNMEICAESAYKSHKNPPHRLVRPDPLKYLKRKKREAQSLARTFDVFCAKSKSDWKHPEGCNASKPGIFRKPKITRP